MSIALLDHAPLTGRKFRFDAAAPLRGILLSDRGNGRASARPTRGVLLPNRRREERHEAATHWAWVGWRTWRGFRMNDALIINISRGGALVFLDEIPPAQRSVWVYVETPDLETILPAKVLEITTTRQGQCAIRLSFRQPPPLGLFDVAVCGLPAVQPKRNAHDRQPGKVDPSGPEAR